MMEWCPTAWQRSSWSRIVAGVVLVFAVTACAEQFVTLDPAVPPTPLSADEKADGSEEMARERAAEFLAGEMGVGLDSLNVVSATAMAWSDTSLGCPQPDQGYAQVITPGYLVLIRDNEGTEHTVHTDQDGSSVLVCDKQPDRKPIGSLTELPPLESWQYGTAA